MGTGYAHNLWKNYRVCAYGAVEDIFPIKAIFLYSVTFTVLGLGEPASRRNMRRHWGYYPICTNIKNSNKKNEEY
jgi:hypothetical protein